MFCFIDDFKIFSAPLSGYKREPNHIEKGSGLVINICHVVLDQKLLDTV